MALRDVVAADDVVEVYAAEDTAMAVADVPGTEAVSREAADLEAELSPPILPMLSRPPPRPLSVDVAALAVVPPM